LPALDSPATASLSPPTGATGQQATFDAQKVAGGAEASLRAAGVWSRPSPFGPALRLRIQDRVTIRTWHYRANIHTSLPLEPFAGDGTMCREVSPERKAQTGVVAEDGEHRTLDGNRRNSRC